MADEPPDFTDRYNTPLSPDQEQTFQTWVANRSNAIGRDAGRDLFDYDVRGQWLAGQSPKPGEHGIDTFKKPNHPTFSTQSQYHGADDHQGGEWLRQGDKWAYRPSRTNLDMYGSAGLGRYFSEREPETNLMMPGRAVGGQLPSSDYLERHRQAERLRRAEMDAGRMERAPPEVNDWGLDRPTRNLQADRADPWWSPEMRHGGMIHRADGGDLIEQTGATETPQAQAMIQRFSGMPGEQLQELTARLGPGSAAGQLAQRVLRQKRILPSSGEMGFGQAGGRGMPRPPAAPTFEDPLKDAAANLKSLKGIGGSSDTDAEGFAAGGMPHLGRGLMPLEARNALRTMAAPPTKGFLATSTPGRSDVIKGTPAADSYVLPADLVSGIGHGNSLAGGKILDSMFKSGPYGMALPHAGGGRGPPRPPPAFHMKAGGVPPEKVDVMLAGGEYVVEPEAVLAIGGGNAKRGHRILDAFVKHMRAKTIKQMSSLPGPIRE